MSLDLSLHHTLATDEPYCVYGVNLTYNYGPMWCSAIGKEGQLCKVEGMKGREARVLFQMAVDAIESDPAHYKTLEPSNGWGTVETFLKKMKECIQVCIEWPEAEWSAYR